MFQYQVRNLVCDIARLPSLGMSGVVNNDRFFANTNGHRRPTRVIDAQELLEVPFRHARNILWCQKLGTEERCESVEIHRIIKLHPQFSSQAFGKSLGPGLETTFKK